jgi:hypothetical protein
MSVGNAPKSRRAAQQLHKAKTVEALEFLSRRASA